MKSIDGPGCGVEDHAPECLCDVKIGEPTPILADFRLMWGIERFRPGRDTLTVLERLTRAHDELLAAEATPARGTDEDRERLRLAIQGGARVETALVDLDLAVGDFVMLITRSPKSNLNKWTLLDVIEFEEMIEQRASVNRAVDTFGIDKTLAVKLFNLFGVEACVEKDYRRKLTEGQKEQLVLWAMEEGVSQMDVVRKVREAFGVSLSRAYISYTQKRERERRAASAV